MALSNLQQTIKQELARCITDYVYAIKKYFHVEHPIKGKILFNLFPFQEETIRALQKNRFVVIGKSRQMGISTVMAAYALLNMLFKENYKVLVIATTQDVAANLVRKVRIMYDHLPSFFKAKYLVSDNKLSMELPNGSFIKAVSSSTHSGRSEALSLLIIDEAAFVDRFEEIWTASQMTLATGGDAVILSTPNGVGNLFHKIFTEAEEGKSPEGLEKFYPLRLPWYLHPERDQTWRDQQTALLGPRAAAQECDVDFLGSGATVIDPDALAYYKTKVVKDPIEYRGPNDEFWIWKYPQPGRSYMIIADTARGDGSDNSTFHILDIDSLEQVGEFQGKIGPTEFGSLLVSVAIEWNRALLIIENTGIGWATVQMALDLRYPNLYYSYKNDPFLDQNIQLVKNYDLKATKDKVPGFTMSHANRPVIISKLETYFRERTPLVYSLRFNNEGYTFIWKNGRAEAEKGYHDDLIIPMGIGLFLRDTALRLKSIGIELTKRTLENTYKQVYKPGLNFNDPWKRKNSRGETEDLRWLL